MIDFQNLGSIPCCVFRRARVVSLLMMISITPVLVGCASAVVGGGAAVGVALGGLVLIYIRDTSESDVAHDDK